MAQGGIVYGKALSNGAGNGDTVMNGTVPPCVSNPSDAAVQGVEAIAEQSAESPDKIFWRKLAKCNQEEFEKSGTNGKCIEARELMIALPESFINYYHDYLLKRMMDKFNLNP